MLFMQKEMMTDVQRSRCQVGKVEEQRPQETFDPERSQTGRQDMAYAGLRKNQL